MAVHRILVLLLASLAFVVACSSPQPSIKLVSSTIGASGGTLTSSDGVVTLTIPAGALSGDVPIGIGPASGVPSGAVNHAYEISPTGTIFTIPATLTMLTGASSATSALAIATVVDAQWSPLATSSSSNGESVSAQLAHLSPYAVVHASLTGAGGTGGNVASNGGNGGGGMAGRGGAAGGSGLGGSSSDQSGSAGSSATGGNSGTGAPGNGGSSAGGSAGGHGGSGGAVAGLGGNGGSSAGGSAGGHGGSGTGGNGGSGNGTGSGGYVGTTGCPSNAIFCNDFETPGLPNGAVYMVSGPSGVVPGDWSNDFAIDTSQHHSGTSSLLVKSTSSGSLNRMLAVQVPNTPFWARFWVESDMPLGGSGHNAFAGAAIGDKPDDLMIEFAEDVGIGLNTGGYDVWPTGYGQLPGGGTNLYTLPAMTWACVELSYDITTNRVQQLFINATELIDGTAYPSTAAFSAGSTITYFKFGFDMHDGPARQMWYDSVVVAPTRIGGCP